MNDFPCCAPQQRIIHGECIAEMRAMPAESIDAIVTDPPYGLGFMGKQWDDLPPGEEWARECLRVLKPGGHLLAFGGTRTWHRLAVAVEDAGFEIRDSIAWMYGSGFPKSLEVSKAIDKAAGAEREVIGRASGARNGNGQNIDYGSFGSAADGTYAVTAPATAEAAKWQGWGTALKPAHEPVVVARKPLEGTVAANVLRHGTGAINVDGCRVETNEDTARKRALVADTSAPFGRGMAMGGSGSPLGRWPANVVLDEDQAAALDAQSGVSKSVARVGRRSGKNDDTSLGKFAGQESVEMGHSDQGGASRFFYCAKAPKNERPVVDGVAHPTVKPLSLMRWLVRLVTPPGGTVLDPFAGSGTTVEAATLEGFDVIGIEREAEYLPLIQARLDRVA